MRLKRAKTDRGFKRVEFTDLYGEKCSLQMSSIAQISAVWFGCEHETMLPDGQPCGARMHLDRGRLKKLLPLLQHFVETGELP